MSKKLATRKSTEMSADVKEKMAAAVAKTRDRIQLGGGRQIRTRGRRFTFPDETKQNGPLEVVVVDYMAWNTYYDPEIPYDEENPVPPICYAFNEEPRKLAHSPNCKEPQMDPDELCSKCQFNQFGSHPNGKGKACQNRRLLAVLPPDATEEDEIMVISVSPSAVSKFDALVAECADSYGVTPLGVITEVDFNEAVDYPSLVFEVVEENPDVNFYFSKITEARSMITAEPSYETDDDDKPKAQPKRKALAKKKAAPKKKVTKKRAARR